MLNKTAALQVFLVETLFGYAPLWDGIKKTLALIAITSALTENCPGYACAVTVRR